MYVPAHFRDDDRDRLIAFIRASGLATLVTATAEGPFATPLPLLFDEHEGEFGTLYGHLARANPHWRMPAIGHALVIFHGPDAYVSPSWYPSKQDHGKVVPTWNYVMVQALGPVEFFDDAERLRDIVTRLTERHEAGRAEPWRVADAPADFVRAQLRAIVGVRLPIVRLLGKRKLSQNRSPADRLGVAEALATSVREGERAISRLILEASGRDAGDSKNTL
jgi:transcriptional regulator